MNKSSFSVYRIGRGSDMDIQIDDDVVVPRRATGTLECSSLDGTSSRRLGGHRAQDPSRHFIGLGRAK